MNPRIDCFVDRFEDDIAILITGDRQLLIPMELLPAGMREGDHLSISFTFDLKTREDISTDISDLQQRLNNNNSPTDSEG